MEYRLMNLKDTIQAMVSDDYKERFKAEYFQVQLRYNKLVNMLGKWDNGLLEFECDCPRSIYELQREYMEKYMAVLEARARIEGVNLYEGL